METAGSTNNYIYKRARAIADGFPDPSPDPVPSINDFFKDS